MVAPDCERQPAHAAGETRLTAHRPSPILLIIGAFLCLGVIWSVLIPPFEKPDEIHHLAYIRFVASTGRVPQQLVDNAPFLVGEAHQPPLYYASAAVLYRLLNSTGMAMTNLFQWEARVNPSFVWSSTHKGQDANLFMPAGTFLSPESGFPFDVIVMRLSSIALGALTLVFIYATARIVLHADDWLACAVASLVAFMPQFTFITSSVNNDGAAIALAAVCTFQIVRMVGAARSDQVLLRDYGLLGLTIGAGLLAKLTLMSLVPFGFWPALISAKSAWRSRVSAVGAYVAGVAIVSGWWFVRNVLLYGDIMGSQWSINPAAFAWDLAPKSLLSPYFVSSFFWGSVAQSFVGKFGFMNVDMPSAYYWLCLFLFGVSVVGLVLWALRRGHSRMHAELSLLFGLMILLALAELIVLNLSASQPQGRYLFHALAPAVILFVVGMRESSRVARQAIHKVFPALALPSFSVMSKTIVLVAILVTLNLYALFGVILPVYAK
jgi:hypothetical protein